MKRVTASDARRRWFRLLDEVAAGEVVAIERHGVRILVQREETVDGSSEIPDYTGILSAPGAESADEWGWRWPGEGEDLVPTEEAGVDEEGSR
jgi:hypothetical protein